MKGVLQLRNYGMKTPGFLEIMELSSAYASEMTCRRYPSISPVFIARQTRINLFGHFNQNKSEYPFIKICFPSVQSEIIQNYSTEIACLWCPNDSVQIYFCNETNVDCVTVS